MLTFDIETVPTAAAMALPYPEADRSPPGSYKSEDAIARWRESDREKWEADRIKAYSLNPRLGRVVAIGTKLPMDEECLLARTESEEAGVLDEFWDTVRAYRTVAGWNSLGFDFPFLVRRSLILGVDLSGIDVPQYTRRYSYRPHFDAKMALLNWPSGYPAGEGLSEWATAFGFPAKSGHGSEVYAMFTEGRFEDLAAYCLDDVRATGAIARRIAPVFGVEEAERLAYIGEHHHPDLTWKARVPELVSDLRTAESEVARLREVNGKLVALCDDLLHAIGGVTLYGGPLGFVAAYRAALAALTQEAPDA